MTNASISKSQANAIYGTAIIAGGRALNQKTVDFFSARKITKPTLEACGIYSTNRADGTSWIAFPTTVGEEEINTKYRNAETKDFTFDKTSDMLYGFGEFVDDMVIVEGEIDCLTLVEAGFKNVFSVSNGASGSVDWLKVPRSCKSVILAPDADEKGKELFGNLLDVVGRPRCKFVKFPKGCKDFNDVLVKYGVEAVQEVVGAARYVNAGGVYNFSDLPPMPPQKSWSLRLPMMECNIREGEFSVITGFPGVGKTTILNIMAREMVDQGVKIAFASFEQPPYVQLPKLVAAFNRGEAVSGESRKTINDNIKLICPPEFVGGDIGVTTDLGWLLEQMSAVVIRDGVKWIIVDPWNEIEHNIPSSITQTMYIQKALIEIKRFAREYGVHITVVAHPAKPQEGSKKPSLYSISDSAHWYNKADLGLIFSRHLLETGQWVNEIQIAKSRYEEGIGKLDSRVYEIAFSSMTLIPAPDGTKEEIYGKRAKSFK